MRLVLLLSNFIIFFVSRNGSDRMKAGVGSQIRATGYFLWQSTSTCNDGKMRYTTLDLAIE